MAASGAAGRFPGPGSHGRSPNSPGRSPNPGASDRSPAPASPGRSPGHGSPDLGSPGPGAPGRSPGPPVDLGLLMEALDFVRPALQSDGGDLTLLGVDEDGVVEVEMIGACRTCPLSMVTLTAGIEAVLLQRVPGVTGVVSQLPPPAGDTTAPPFSPAEALASAGDQQPAAAPVKPPRRLRRRR